MKVALSLACSLVVGCGGAPPVARERDHAPSTPAPTASPEPSAAAAPTVAPRPLAPPAPEQVETAAPTTLDPSGASLDEALAGNVLVWLDAPFRLDSDERATSFQLATFEGAARRERLGRVVPLRVVATKGPFVEVAALPPPDAGTTGGSGCVWTGLGTSSDIARATFFVHRQDLAPVLSAPFSATFDDGSRVSLSPGIAVLPAGDGYVASLFTQWVPVKPPAESIRHSYRPVPETKGAGAEAPIAFSLDPKADVRVGGASVYSEPKSFGVFASKVEARGAATLFPIEWKCARVTAVVPSGAVQPYSSSPSKGTLGAGMGSGGSAGPRPERWWVPPGTPLVTPAGRVAASTAIEIAVSKDDAARKKAICVDARVWVSTPYLFAPITKHEDAKVSLCAAASAVKHAPADPTPPGFGALRGLGTSPTSKKR